MKPKYDHYSVGSLTKNVDDAKKKIKSYGSAPATESVAEELSVERTYKMYVGGKQTRPETSNSKPVYYEEANGKPKAYALVPDASRKDVRNAVEAAKSSFNRLVNLCSDATFSSDSFFCVFCLVGGKDLITTRPRFCTIWKRTLIRDVISLLINWSS